MVHLKKPAEIMLAGIVYNTFMAFYSNREKPEKDCPRGQLFKNTFLTCGIH